MPSEIFRFMTIRPIQEAEPVMTIRRVQEAGPVKAGKNIIDLNNSTSDFIGRLVLLRTYIPRNRLKVVPRVTLDEDGNPNVNPDAIQDQIRCKIRIEPFGFPPVVTAAFTNQEVLEILPPQGILEAETSG